MLRNVLLAICTILLFAHCQESEQEVLIETAMGNMTIKLFNSTPQHRDNFIKLAEEGFYDGLLFHRVMSGFMIQGGDPDSRDAPPQQMLGQGGPGYTLPAEIGAYHFKGALSSARLPDQMNPEKESSGSQFFIVQGYQVAEEELDQWSSRKGLSYSAEDKERYMTEGGYPFLDGDYTVFGQVVEGMDVIDKIAGVATGQADRPVEDVEMKISVL